MVEEVEEAEEVEEVEEAIFLFEEDLIILNEAENL